MGLYCFIQDCFKFVPKIISGQGLSVGVDIFSSHVQFPFYTLPVGFPLDGEFMPALGVFLGAYINFSLNGFCGRIFLVRSQSY